MTGGASPCRGATAAAVAAAVGSWCQQTARAFPCGQWHASRVTGSLCAFATRMETGLFKQQAFVIRELTGSIFAQKVRIHRTKTVPSIKCLASCVQSMPPCQIVVALKPLVQTRIWTRLHTFCFNLCLVRSRTMSRKARSVVPSHKLVVRNPIATAS